MGKVLGKLIGEAAGTVVPGGKLYFKTLQKGINWVSRIVQRKKDKATARKEAAEAKLAQLKSLDFQGLQNTGTDYPETPAQKGVFGSWPTMTTTAPVKTDAPLSLLVKDYETDEQNTQQNDNKMEWIKKNWYYLVGGAAALYFLMGKKRR